MIQKIYSSLWAFNQKQVVYEQLKHVLQDLQKKEQTSKNQYFSMSNCDKKKWNRKKKENRTPSLGDILENSPGFFKC